MTTEEAAIIINRLVVTVQKARSNLRESLAGPQATNQIEEQVLAFIDPALFPAEGKIDILEALLRVQNIYNQSKVLDNSVVYNMLFLAHRSQALELTYVMLWETEMPEPMDALRVGTLKSQVAAALEKLDKEMNS